MMVSKIAVVALVAILAVPILLGYAMNLSTETESDYRTVDDSVNVTSLLQNGQAYTFSHGNAYQLNTDFQLGSSKINVIYEQIGSVRSSLTMNQGTFSIGAGQFSGSYFSNITENTYYYMEPGSNVTFADLSNDGQTSYFSVNNVQMVFFEPSIQRVTYSVNDETYTYYIHGNNDMLFFRNNGASSTTLQYSTTQGSSGKYVNLAAGFHFRGTSKYWQIQVPNDTRKMLLTVDLDSITDSSYGIHFSFSASYVYLDKTTDGSGNVTWTISNPYDSIQLYYDPAGDNVYQLMIEKTFLGSTPEEPNYDAYDVSYDFRYVGSWPSLIGEANYYHNFNTTYRFYVAKGSATNADHLTVNTYNRTPVDHSPRMRVDDAYFRAFQYNVIQDKVYTPSSFRTIPSTKITNIQLYGNSIEFGGNTYAVTDGKITLGSQKVPVDKLSFNSIPNADLGGYDNMIGNTFISNTADPSTITFNGQWAASVSTQSMEYYTYNTTEWHAGEFGWNGIDQNFLIVGLITCLGVFIGLGIYARKRGTGGIIPLMIVVGGAAMVFFVML